MAHRNDGVAAGNRKLVDRRYGSLQGVDPPFEPRDGFGRQRSDLLAARFPAGQQGFDGHQPRKDAVQVVHIRRQCGIGAHIVAQQRRKSSQFIYRAVRFDPFVGLENPLAADQRRGPLVARFGVYFHIRKCCFGKLLLKISRYPLLSTVVERCAATI